MYSTSYSFEKEISFVPEQRELVLSSYSAVKISIIVTGFTRKAFIICKSKQRLLLQQEFSTCYIEQYFIYSNWMHTLTHKVKHLSFKVIFLENSLKPGYREHLDSELTDIIKHF